MEQEGRSKSPGSEALQIFRTNLDNVMYLLHVISSDTKQVNDPIVAAHRMIAHTTAAVTNLKKRSSDGTEFDAGVPLAQISGNLDALKKDIDEIGAILQANVKVHPFFYDWILVMMVTFAEGYLENVLLLLVTAHPAWMQTKETLKVSVADLSALEATPDTEKRWQELMSLLRKRWVKQFLNDSPGEWIARLKKRGAPGYRASLAEDMKTVWDRRHAIVHSPPATRSAEVTGLSGPVISNLKQSLREFQEATSVISSFVETTDAFVVGVLNAQHSS